MKYLTKFKLASECPTKLFYTGKSEYVNNSIDNPFLEALADGGYQVGELAKYYYSNGAKQASQIVTETKEAIVQVICKEKE